MSSEIKGSAAPRASFEAVTVEEQQILLRGGPGPDSQRVGDWRVQELLKFEGRQFESLVENDGELRWPVHLRPGKGVRQTRKKP